MHNAEVPVPSGSVERWHSVKRRLRIPWEEGASSPLDPEPKFNPPSSDSGIGYAQREAESLQAEIEQLQDLLAARTAAWREALRQLSQVQDEIDAAGQSSLENRRIQPLSEEDWVRIHSNSLKPRGQRR
jgi:hypothetical protein